MRTVDDADVERTVVESDRVAGAKPGGSYAQLPTKIIQMSWARPSIVTSNGSSSRNTRAKRHPERGPFADRALQCFARLDQLRVAPEARGVEEGAVVDGADVDNDQLVRA